MRLLPAYLEAAQKPVDLSVLFYNSKEKRYKDSAETRN